MGKQIELEIMDMGIESWRWKKILLGWYYEHWTTQKKKKEEEKWVWDFAAWKRERAGLWVLKVFVWYGVHEVFPKSSRTPLMKPTSNVFFFFLHWEPLMLGGVSLPDLRVLWLDGADTIDSYQPLQS